MTTARSWDEQAATHMALGLNLVGPGEPWRDYGGPGLFDAVYQSDANDTKGGHDGDRGD